ncbi:MAG: carbohydrate-binding domain-containing protein, partial [Ruminococcus sp.]|nr:carbohydrate-binding domain-containing protein [Ruminococcus sp.]
MKKLLAIILSALLIITMCTLTAFALDTNVDLGEQNGRLEITEAGSYILTGTLQGTVYVDPGEGDVELILDGADIYGGENPGIYAVSGNSLTIFLPENSVNRISGNEGNLYSATIYSTIDTTFDGDGALYVISDNENGIATEDADLTFDGGSYAITAPENGIAADGQEQGELTVNDGHFSILAENTVDPEANFFMNGGAFDEPFPENLSINGHAPQMNGTQQNGQQPHEMQGSVQQNSQQPPEMQNGTQQYQQNGQQPPQMNNSSQQPQMNGNMPQNNMQNNASSSGSASEVVQGTMTNSAADLEADYDNATYITVSDDNSQIKITSSGTYVVSGTCSDGNITVKKGTTGVVLVLEDLDLTSTTGATVSVNKEAEVKIIISGNVVLTDNENPDDEYSTDEEVADAYDGAALKAKANSQVYVTGDGTLTINGNAKNGVKAGDDSSIIFDGVTVNITAINDG